MGFLSIDQYMHRQSVYSTLADGAMCIAILLFYFILFDRSVFFYQMLSQLNRKQKFFCVFEMP